MHPLPGLLGMLLLGIRHGRDSLRGAWVWAQQQWPYLWRTLGIRSPHFPCYQTVRGLVSRLDADAVDRSVRPWVEQLLEHPVGWAVPMANGCAAANGSTPLGSICCRS
jgi:hypothetical protein